MLSVLKYVLSASLVIALMQPADCVAQSETEVTQDAATAEMTEDLARIEALILEVQAERARYAGGTIRLVLDYRLAVLGLTRDLLDQRLHAPEVTVAVPVTQPDREAAAELAAEIGEAEADVALAEVQAIGRGGLVGAVAQMELAAARMRVSLLEFALLSRQYGLGLPMLDPSAISAEGRGSDVEDQGMAVGLAGPEDTGGMSPAEFRRERRYESFSRTWSASGSVTRAGEWLILRHRSPLDDSLSVTAMNIAEVPTMGGISTLTLYCVEDEEAALADFDEYLLGGRRDRVWAQYRFDDDLPESAYWSLSTSHEATGLWGEAARPFMERLADAERFYLRVTEDDNEAHDFSISLTGIDEAVAAVADACGWLADGLSQEQIMGVQTILSGLGYDTGGVDGIWGSGSRNALQRYQQDLDLETTGVLDRSTLESLGCVVRAGSVDCQE